MVITWTKARGYARVSRWSSGFLDRLAPWGCADEFHDKLMRRKNCSLMLVMFFNYCLNDYSHIYIYNLFLYDLRLPHFTARPSATCTALRKWKVFLYDIAQCYVGRGKSFLCPTITSFRSPGVQWGITTCDECGFCACVLCHNLRKGGITFWSKAMESCRFCSLCICGTVCSTKGKQCGTFLGPFKKSHMKSHIKPYEGMKNV